MNEAIVSWAGRVRNGNKSKFEYNQDNEVTCRFFPGSSRDDIYQLLQEIKFGVNNLEGIVTRPGQLADFTVKNKPAAIKLAELLQKSGKVKNVTAYALSIVDVRFEYVPPNFPDAPILDYLRGNHGEVQNFRRITDKYGIQNGVRIFKLNRQDLENRPLPSFLYFGKYKFSIRYIGQEATCGFCAEVGHIERDCGKKQQQKMSTFKRQGIRRIGTSIPADHQKQNYDYFENKGNVHHVTEKKNDTVTINIPQESNFDKSYEMVAAQNVTEESTSDKEANTHQTDEDCNKEQTDKENISKKLQNKSQPIKRPHSDSSPGQLKNKSKHEIIDNDHSIFSSESSVSFNEIFLDCCKNTIDNCEINATTCMCGLKYFKCECQWRLFDLEKLADGCDTCEYSVAQCKQCEGVAPRDEENLFNCVICKHSFDITELEIS